MVNDNQEAAQDFQVVNHIDSGVFQSRHFLSSFSLKNKKLLLTIEILVYYEGKRSKRKEEKSIIFFWGKKNFCEKITKGGWQFAIKWGIIKERKKERI